jgi:ankyrin repeat protein
LRQQLKRLENCAHRVDRSFAMKSILVSIVAAVLLVGCGESQQSSTTPETKPVGTVAETAKPKPPTAKASDISIHDAAHTGNIEAVKQHLAAGADVNAKGGLGWTPLHFAVYYGHKEIAELLIAKGADVNAKTIAGRTPLHRAAREGHKEVIELLIAKGADVNAKDNNGWTPLHYASMMGHKEIVELLIANDADVNAKDDFGDTPLDLAVRHGGAETADLLRKHGGKTSEELEAAGN